MKDTNIPFTHVINALAIASLASKQHQEYILPMSLGALFTGSVSAQVFPDGIAKKYGLSVPAVKMADVFAHWLPAYLLIRSTKKKVRSHHMLVATLAPLVYFSFKYKTLETAHPVKHIMATYPGVPFWVFTLYLGGVISTQNKRFRHIF